MIIRLIFTVLIIYFVFRLVKGLLLPSGKRQENFPRKQASIPGEDLVKDPYCGTYIPVSNAKKVTIDGKELYFCSNECIEKYKTRERTN
ncbi:MAG: YHS domain-containing protein [Deltaproteobacteria bacterium]|nr:YHS domain-containing protein [Deltaproteobacteria bacterium]